jgi:hypothetical protein
MTSIGMQPGSKKSILPSLKPNGSCCNFSPDESYFQIFTENVETSNNNASKAK